MRTSRKRIEPAHHIPGERENAPVGQLRHHGVIQELGVVVDEGVFVGLLRLRRVLEGFRTGRGGLSTGGDNARHDRASFAYNSIYRITAKMGIPSDQYQEGYVGVRVINFHKFSLRISGTSSSDIARKLHVQRGRR